MTTQISEQDTLDLAHYLPSDACDSIHGTADTPEEWTRQMAAWVGLDALLDAAERVHVDLRTRVADLLGGAPMAANDPAPRGWDCVEGDDRATFEASE